MRTRPWSLAPLPPRRPASCSHRAALIPRLALDDCIKPTIPSIPLLPLPSPLTADESVLPKDLAMPIRGGVDDAYVPTSRVSTARTLAYME